MFLFQLAKQLLQVQSFLVALALVGKEVVVRLLELAALSRRQRRMRLDRLFFHFDLFRLCTVSAVFESFVDVLLPQHFVLTANLLAQVADLRDELDVVVHDRQVFFLVNFAFLFEPLLERVH